MGYRLVVDDADVAATVRSVLLPADPSATSGPIVATYRFGALDRRLDRDGTCLATGDLAAVVDELVFDITYRTIDAAAQHGTVLHAAAVRRHDRVVLLLGPTGTGKSTLSCFLAQRGWEFLGDDAVSVLPGPSIVGSGLPAKLRPASLSLLDPLDVALPSLTATPSGQTYVGWPRAVGVDPYPSVMVALHRSDNVATELRELSKTELLRELAFSTFAFADNQPRLFPVLADLADEVPGLTLTYDGLADAAAALEDVALAP